MAILTDRDAIPSIALGDVAHWVDVSDTTGNAAGTSKKGTFQQIIDALNGSAQLDNESIDAAAAIDASKIANGTVSSAEFQFLGGVTSDIQTQLDAKGVGDALTSNPLSQFAATTSAQLLGVMSDETGTGSLVFGSSPTIVTPTIASFANAGHDHADAAGGGQLLSTSALSDTANIAYLASSNTFTQDQFITGNLSINDATRSLHCMWWYLVKTRE